MSTEVDHQLRESRMAKALHLIRARYRREFAEGCPPYGGPGWKPNEGQCSARLLKAQDDLAGAIRSRNRARAVNVALDLGAQALAVLMHTLEE